MFGFPKTEKPKPSDRNLLLALCKYHSKLKDRAEELKERIATEPMVPAKAKGIAHEAANYWRESKAILWILNRRRQSLKELFGVEEPEEAIHFDFDESDEDPSISSVDFVPVQYLGLKKGAVTRKDYARNAAQANIPLEPEAN
jgi:hypothetical protein